MMTLGMRLENQTRIRAAEQLGELVEHDLHDVLRRGEQVEHLGGKAALLRAGDKRFDHREVDVRLKQRKTDLAHGGVDVVLGQTTLGLQTRRCPEALGRFSNIIRCSSTRVVRVIPSCELYRRRQARHRNDAVGAITPTNPPAQAVSSKSRRDPSACGRRLRGSRAVFVRERGKLRIAGKRRHARAHVEHARRVRITLVADGTRDTVGHRAHAPVGAAFDRRLNGTAMGVPQHEQKAARADASMRKPRLRARCRR